MKNKWKVVKHGTNYVEVSSPIICPECGDLIEKVDSIKSLSSGWFFFNILRRHWTEERCICKNCNCELSKQINKRLQVDWSDLLAFITFPLLVISVIAGCIFIPLFAIYEEFIFMIFSFISIGIFIISLIMAVVSS